ncbi:MAG: hypothetical protein KCHDKBKB_01369 [Elusimicrobia bacterium]|nr:hypothetical protein [Elusimicrobiota bacterium]
MINLKLTSGERDMLIRVLDVYFSDLRNEISNTESWEYKDNLKNEEKFLNRIMGELKTDKAMEEEKKSRK